MLNFIQQNSYIPNDTGLLVLIDCGHGGIVDGEYTTAPSKMYDHGDFVFYEGVFNRKVGIKLAREFRKLGMNYQFITTSNEDIKLSARTDKANELNNTYHNLKCVYLSIHGNAAGVESANGIEVFTSKGETESDNVAFFIFQALEEMGWKMRADYVDGDPDKESNFWVLRKTVMPAVLVELGFFTNKEQAINMLNDKTQTKLAFLLAKALNEYQMSL